MYNSCPFLFFPLLKILNKTVLGYTSGSHVYVPVTTDSLIIFFYVDDIVIAFQKDDRPKAEKLVKDLQAIIELKVIGEVQWFLRMRITRDRKRHQLSLDQSNYIDAVAERFGVTINTTKL